MHIGVLMRVYEDNIDRAMIAADNIIHRHSYEESATSIYIKRNIPIHVFKEILDEITDDYDDLDEDQLLLKLSLSDTDSDIEDIENIIYEMCDYDYLYIYCKTLKPNELDINDSCGLSGIEKYAYESIIKPTILENKLPDLFIDNFNNEYVMVTGCRYEGVNIEDRTVTFSLFLDNDTGCWDYGDTLDSDRYWYDGGDGPKIFSGKTYDEFIKEYGEELVIDSDGNISEKCEDILTRTFDYISDGDEVLCGTVPKDIFKKSSTESYFIIADVHI